MAVITYENTASMADTSWSTWPMYWVDWNPAPPADYASVPIPFAAWLVWFLWARWIISVKVGIVSPLKDDKAIGKHQPIQLQSSYG